MGFRLTPHALERITKPYNEIGDYRTYLSPEIILEILDNCLFVPLKWKQPQPGKNIYLFYDYYDPYDVDTFLKAVVGTGRPMPVVTILMENMSIVNHKEISREEKADAKELVCKHFKIKDWKEKRLKKRILVKRTRRVKA